MIARSTRPRCVDRVRRGFALLDMLIALMIGGLAVVAMNASLRLLQTAYSGTALDERATRILLGTSGAFEAIVATLGPYRPGRAPLPQSIRGSSTALHLFGRGPAVLGLNDPTELRLTLRPENDGAAILVLDWVDDAGRPNSYDVSGPLFGARFEFVDRSGETEVRSSWNELRPPELVVLFYKVKPEGEEVRSDVHPSVDKAAFCSLTPDQFCWDGS